MGQTTRIKNVDQSPQVLDFILVENDHFCDADVAFALKETRPFAAVCVEVDMSAASRFCFLSFPRSHRGGN